MTRILAQRYELQSEIAGGGAAAVWQGVDQVTEEPVAVKVLHPRLRAETDSVEAFFAEAEALAELSHPNIVEVKDFIVTDDIAATVLEHVPNGDLKNRVRQDGPLSPHSAALLCADVAQALAHVHDTGLIHGDVKPGNILLGEDYQAKLIDFGTVRPHDDPRPPSHGTAEYAAPEIALGQPVSGASDVYALAVVLFECMSGGNPYRGGGDVETVLRRHVDQIPPCPVDVDGQLWNLLAAALTVRPNERPSAAQFAQGLRAVAPRLSRAAGAVTHYRLVDRRLAPAMEPTPPQPPVAVAAPADGGRHTRTATVTLAAGIAVGLSLVGALLFFPRGDAEETAGDDQPSVSVEESSPDPASSQEESETPREPQPSSDEPASDGPEGGEDPGESESEEPLETDEPEPSEEPDNEDDTDQVPGEEHLGSPLPGNHG
ncbi:serine/threonine protein kinase [Haloglycomyces albus]|uniref:serine/threonine protein kinase n=1 Tax=Haloglycomyces albus TaxID=526067 RepID=UPI00046CD315|nr:serine/threonine-protein kinase [Haloglycomyces albus]